MKILLNKSGCPSNVRFAIIEDRIDEKLIIEKYTSIIGVQYYLDARHDRTTYHIGGFPAKCRFYIFPTFGSIHDLYPTAEEAWEEALSIKELVEYLDD